MSRPEVVTQEIKNRLASYCKERALDALVLSSPDNVTYAIGVTIPSHARNRFRRTFAVVFPKATLSLIVVNVEYSFAKDNSHYDLLHQYREFYESPSAALAGILIDAGLERGRIGMELDHLPAQDLMELRRLLPKGIETQSCGPDILRVREVKLDWELEQIRRAANITSTAYESLRSNARVGWTEIKVAEHLMGVCQEEGVDQVRAIVGSGQRSLHANAYPTRKRIDDGDVVRLDLLCQVNGYWADVARTMAAGRVPIEADRAWQDLLQVHLKSLGSVSAADMASSPYESYEKSMAQMGLKPGLSFLGHGLGLTLHEDPYLRRGNDRQLLKGSVLCFEPYAITDTFALHVEDEVYLSDSGAPEVLTAVPSPEALPRFGDTA